MTDRIEKSIELRAPIEQVWRALTDPVEFGQWFRVKLDEPFVPGQRTRGHITYPGYEHLKWEVVTATMDEPRLFSFHWHPYATDPDVDYAKEKPTLVEFRLEPTAEGTRLEIIESGFDGVPAHRREEAMRRNGDGWAQQIENIKAHVES